MSEMSERELRSYVEQSFSRFSLSTKLWSFAYHGFMFGAATLSALAAFILKLQTEPQEALQARADVAAALAALAALMGIVSASGGFGRKWKANRSTKSKLAQIRIDLLDSSVDQARVRGELKELIRVHDLTILGEDPQEPA